MDDFYKKPLTSEEFWDYAQNSFEHEMLKDLCEVINEMDFPVQLDREKFYRVWESMFSLHLRQ